MNKEVGVCLLNWNGLRFTATCLLSLMEQDYKNIKIYVLDQGSTDGSLQWLKKLAATNAIDLTDAGKNVGFSTGNNMLMEKALKDECEYILIFNNDTRAFPDMVSTMIKCFEDNKDCGACGVPAYEYDHGLKNWAEAKRIWGIGGWIRRDDEMVKVDGFGKYWTDPNIRECPKCKTKLPLNLQEPSNVDCPNCKINMYSIEYVPCNYVGGGCLMTSKEAISKVGMFDERFSPIYEEDVSFCCSLRENGYKVIHINKSGFNHAVSAFTGGYNRMNFWKKHQENKAKFINLWKDKIDANIV